MPPPSPAPGTPLEWLDRAKGKLALANEPLPQGAFWEDMCYLSQQAAELGIKSVYQVHGWIFPFVHNLSVLLDGLESHGLTIPPDVQVSDRLSGCLVGCSLSTKIRQTTPDRCSKSTLQKPSETDSQLSPPR
jgi:hypothetical protein